MAEAKEAPRKAQAKPKVETFDPSPDCGYLGFRPDPTPAAEYSLTTGPDAPALVSDDRTRVEQHQLPKEA